MFCLPGYLSFACGCQQKVASVNQDTFFEYANGNCDPVELNIAYDAFKTKKKGQGTTKIDVFTPDQYRPISDLSPFYATFHITEPNKMYLPEPLRIKVW